MCSSVVNFLQHYIVSNNISKVIRVGNVIGKLKLQINTSFCRRHGHGVEDLILGIM